MINTICFACVGNICRSPMAAGAFGDLTGDRYRICSAGIGALVGEPADPIAISLMAERDIDISKHIAQQIDDTVVSSSDLIFVMETQQSDWIERSWPQARGRIFRLGHWGKFDIPDPYRHGEEAFREALTLIDKGASQWRDKLSQLS